MVESSGAAPRVAIVGGGVVGSALGRAWCAAGVPVTGVASRSRSSARAAAAFIGGDGPAPPSTTQAERLAADADVIVIAVPDDAITEVAATLASAPEHLDGRVVAHCAGAWPADVLDAIVPHGAEIGGCHPLQAFASAEAALPLLAGTVFGIEGTPHVQAVLGDLVRRIGGVAFAIAPGTKAAYHAAAAVISNYTTVLADAAAELLQAAGAESRAAALELLQGLLAGTVSNLQRVGLPQALTGPIARGDVETVRAHLGVLRDRAPDLLPLYAAAGRRAVGLACAKGSLGAEAADVLRTMLAAQQA